ncbi:MAG: hypothetical protein IPH28_19880 [Cytophagaceae bacterium]|nr:hypothetical protein [Cytophagaceae bacterium]
MTNGRNAFIDNYPWYDIFYFLPEVLFSRGLKASKEQYERLKAVGMPYKVALIAVCNKLL